MTNQCKFYLTSIIGAAALVLAAAGMFSSFGEMSRYAGYLALGLLASTWKVRLPKMTGSTSVNFVFIVLGIVQLSLLETLALGSAAVILQCLWKSRRPSAVQVMFNVAVQIIGIGAAFVGTRALTQYFHIDSVILAVGFAAAVLYAVSATLVSGVVALTEEKSFVEIWRNCYLWSFPYYLIMGGIAGLVVASSHHIGWQAAILLLPVMYLSYTYYRVLLNFLQVNLRGMTSGLRRVA
jgi:hypothetical protein